MLVAIDDQTRLARLAFCGILKVYWALSSVGRAPASHAGGRRFKSGRVHFNRHQKQGVLQSKSIATHLVFASKLHLHFFK